ncbi:unnamed protein product [Mesocestoides corti]|uniref:Aquaporin n=1 Tax=Mesocestoides corti TaxID=53468 RepID=A0A0R3UQH2_MESCO|nr:unnamed protein product [Mesocestoides corti]
MAKCNVMLLWKLFQTFMAEVLASGLAHLFCFLLDINTPNLPIVAGFIAGASVYLGIWCSFSTSGAQINPVVTLAVVITRRLHPLYAPVYLAGEFVGTIGAMGIAWSISPFKGQAPGTYGMTLPGKEVTSLVAVCTEGVSTFILVIVILASLDELRPKEWRPEHGAPFPLAVMLALTISVILTIYFVGPIMGTIVACALYELVICPHASLRRTRICFCSRKFDRKDSYELNNVAISDSPTT